MLEKITYKCKNCGWSARIVAAWGDLKPKRCPNKKCTISFLKHKDKLEITMPNTGEAPSTRKQKRRKNKKQEGSNAEKTSVQTQETPSKE